MDFTKEYKLTELLAPLLAQVRCRLRSRQPLLVLSLSAASVSYWQQGKMLWSEQLSQAAAGTQELQDELRTLLLAHEVEENIATVLLPQAEDLHSEQLTLPGLPAKEMLQAVAWEAQHCVPWETDSYSYSYSVNDSVVGDKRQCQVQLTALPDAMRCTLEELCAKLLLRLEYISLDTQITAENLAQAWYAGKALPRAYRQRKQQLTLPLAPAKRWLAQLACCVLVLALLAYAGVCGGRYLAQHQLQGVEKQLMQYAVWQERQRESRELEKQILQLQGLLQSAKAPVAQVSGELEALSCQIQPGAWLTVLEYSGAGRPLLLQGQAVDSVAVQTLTERLQRSGSYSRVELVETQQQGGWLAYRLQLLPQEGKSDAKKAQ